MHGSDTEPGVQQSRIKYTVLTTPSGTRVAVFVSAYHLYISYVVKDLLWGRFGLVAALHVVKLGSFWSSQH